MSLVALDGTPLVPMGQPFVGNSESLPSIALSILQDATNEAAIQYGQIFTDDGASHTLDTSGSSSLGWRTGAVTFVNVGSTFKVGLATMNTTTGPPGRATNVADLITFSVSKLLTGGAGISATAWNEHVPDTGSLAVANGDFIAFCTQMITRGGADLVNTAVISAGVARPRPAVTAFVGASYSAQSSVPNVVITFSDGHLGWFFGGSVFLTPSTSQSYGNGSSPNEYGNFFQAPFPMKVYGLYAITNNNGDNDGVLYTDPLGTPVAAKTASVDLNAVSAGSNYEELLFSSPVSISANQPVAAIMKPTTATSINFQYKTYNVAAHQVTEAFGANGYAINRSGGSGAFAAQNSNKDRFAIGLLVGAFDDGTSTGGPVGQQCM